MDVDAWLARWERLDSAQTDRWLRGAGPAPDLVVQRTIRDWQLDSYMDSGRVPPAVVDWSDDVSELDDC